MKVNIVITSIQSELNGSKVLVNLVREGDCRVVVTGDAKSPNSIQFASDFEFFSLNDQMALPFSIVKKIPLNSYARKMIGYLLAHSDERLLFETDDDNALISVDKFSLCQGGFIEPRTDSRWFNPYPYFSKEHIWPRGFPLELISKSMELNGNLEGLKIEKGSSKQLGLIQFLANGSPDVDAVFRLVFGDPQVSFLDNRTVLIPESSYTPFNSQATLWSPTLLPLMYLPITCTFRMTDIWRSFVCQRILGASGIRWAYNSPIVFQDRNFHNLIKDFVDEIPGYINNSEIVDILEETTIKGGKANFAHDLTLLYSRLVENGFLQELELELLNAWLLDVSYIEANNED